MSHPPHVWHITWAARRLFMAQQTLSSKIRHLERLLGVDLLVRTAHGVLLTPAGAALAASSADLLATVQNELDSLVVEVRAAGRPAQNGHKHVKGAIG